jgi:hypothetical protein
VWAHADVSLAVRPTLGTDEESRAIGPSVNQDPPFEIEAPRGDRGAAAVAPNGNRMGAERHDASAQGTERLRKTLISCQLITFPTGASIRSAPAVIRACISAPTLCSTCRRTPRSSSQRAACGKDPLMRRNIWAAWPAKRAVVDHVADGDTIQVEIGGRRRTCAGWGSTRRRSSGAWSAAAGGRRRRSSEC